jgi:hypothetical protein
MFVASYFRSTVILVRFNYRTQVVQTVLLMTNFFTTTYVYLQTKMKGLDSEHIRACSVIPNTHGLDRIGKN